MPTITPSHLRRLIATILIGCVILLPAFMGHASVEGDRSTGPAATAATLLPTAAL